MDRTTNRFLDYRSWSVLQWAIAFNVILTLLVWSSGLFLPFFGLPIGWLGRVLEVKPSLYWLSRYPFSPLTYSLVHDGLLHLVLNMLVLWFAGKRFVSVFGIRRFLPLYILSTLAGSLLYIVGYQLLLLLRIYTLPLGLVGSSAMIMALIFALAFYQPWQRLRTPLGLIGYPQMAGILLLLQLLLMGGNLGGQLAHIGGALTGFIFGYLLRDRGIDITGPIARLLDSLFVWFGRKNAYKRASKQTQHKQAMDEVLSKIRQSGYKSLTEAERKILFEQSGDKYTDN